MKPIFFKSLTILFYLSMCCFSIAYAQTTENPKTQNEEAYNTTLVINLKKNSDRQYLSLAQHNPFFFSPRYVVPPPNTIDNSNDLKTIIKVALDKPTYLSLDFSFLYIEPGDSLNMNFEVLYHYMDYKDTLHINHGNVFFKQRNAESRFLTYKYLNTISDSLNIIKTAEGMAEFLSIEHVKYMGDNWAELIYKEHPNLKQDGPISETVKNFGEDQAINQLMYKIMSLYTNTKDESIRGAIEKSVQNMLEYSCKEEDAFDDTMTWGKYEAIYSFYKEMDLDAQSILEKFNGCNDIVKQYAMLSLYNDGMLSEEEKSGIIDKMTYPTLKEYAIRIEQNPNLKNTYNFGPTLPPPPPRRNN